MKDEDVEKLRTGLEWLKQPVRGGYYTGHINDLLALLPEKPKPEPAPGPYSARLSAHSHEKWIVEDADGLIIAALLDEPTARLLASAWSARELLKRYQLEHREHLQRCLGGEPDCQCVLCDDIDAHFAEYPA